MTRRELVDGLRAGRTYAVTEREAPIAAMLLDLVRRGAPIEVASPSDEYRSVRFREKKGATWPDDDTLGLRN